MAPLLQKAAERNAEQKCPQCHAPLEVVVGLPGSGSVEQADESPSQPEAADANQAVKLEGESARAVPKKKGKAPATATDPSPPKRPRRSRGANKPLQADSDSESEE